MGMDYKEVLCHIRDMGICEHCWERAMEYVREKETEKINGDKPEDSGGPEPA